MNSDEKFLFDLNGYLLVRNLFTKAEVDRMNKSIDTYRDRRQSRDNPVLKNAAAPVSDAAYAAQSQQSKQESGPSTTIFAASGSREDLGGILSWGSDIKTTSSDSDQDTTQSIQQHDSFRKVLSHPKLAPYLIELCGSGYRLDHQPLVILQQPGSEGFSLHGGPMDPATSPDSLDTPSFELQYRWHNGKFYNSLLAVSICLCRTLPSDGGFCVVKGSHKLNYALPKHFATGQSDAFNQECVSSFGGRELGLFPGDVILFSEATIHGALPWRPIDGRTERRLALYRFSPSNVAYGRSYWVEPEEREGKEGEGREKIYPFGIPQDVWDTMSKSEKSVVYQPPFANRCERERVIVTASNSNEGGVEGSGCDVTVSERSKIKKDHDKKTFGTKWF